jgi:hypothetical protein
MTGRFGIWTGSTVRSGAAVAGFVSAACDPIARAASNSIRIFTTIFPGFISISPFQTLRIVRFYTSETNQAL